MVKQQEEKKKLEESGHDAKDQPMEVDQPNLTAFSEKDVNQTSNHKNRKIFFRYREFGKICCERRKNRKTKWL